MKLVHLDLKRSQICEVYHRAVMAPLMTWEWGSLNGGCFRAAKALANYNKLLRQAKIFPFDPEFAKQRFQRLLLKLPI
jgi:hypothetical protein